MSVVRYRSGVSKVDGRVLVGWAHCRQSLATILTTDLDERLMRLAFAGDLRRWIGRNAVAPIVTQLYRAAFTAIRRYEPEYAPKRVQLLGLDGTGRVALGLAGVYYPEGRLGNFAIAEPKGAAFGVAGEVFGLDLAGLGGVP